MCLISRRIKFRAAASSRLAKVVKGRLCPHISLGKFSDSLKRSAASRARPYPCIISQIGRANCLLSGIITSVLNRFDLGQNQTLKHRNGCQQSEATELPYELSQGPLLDRVDAFCHRLPRSAKSEQGIGTPINKGAARATRPVWARFLMVGRVASTFGCAVAFSGSSNRGTSGHQPWNAGPDGIERHRQ